MPKSKRLTQKFSINRGLKKKVWMCPAQPIAQPSPTLPSPAQPSPAQSNAGGRPPAPVLPPTQRWSHRTEFSASTYPMPSNPHPFCLPAICICNYFKSENCFIYFRQRQAGIGFPTKIFAQRPFILPLYLTFISWFYILTLHSSFSLPLF